MVTITSSELIKFAYSASNFDNPVNVFIKVYLDATEDLGTEFPSSFCLSVLEPELEIILLVDSDHSHDLNTC